MKWGVQQIKVTLESDSGETLVVEQRPDGSVRCEPVPKDKNPRKPSTRAPKADRPPTKPKAAPKPEPKAAPKPEPKADKPKPDKPAPRAAQRGEPLEWHAIDDHGYSGIGALVHWGAYKALRSKRAATYALFFETTNQEPRHLGCFRTLDEVKKRAAEVHQNGAWPPFRALTKADVDAACPAPSATAEAPPAEPKPTRARKPRTPKATAPEAQPAPPSPTPADATAATDASQDDELFRSFAAAIAAANIPAPDLDD